MMKRTGAYGAASSVSVGKRTAISKIVGFTEAEPFGSALFLRVY